MFPLTANSDVGKQSSRIATYIPYLKTIFVLTLPFLWFLAIGRYGWSDTDDGFILGYSWRIVNGELPYKDFIYVRPPVSPLLHAFWFSIVPHDYVYALTRFIVILEIEISCLLGSFVLCKHIGGLGWAANGWFVVAIASFFVSVSQFTPMAWHTVDGIFFSILGISFLVTCASPWMTTVSATLLCLAAMTKQSFYPVPLVVLLYLILAKRHKDVAVYLLTLCVLSILMYVVFNKLGIWQEFLNQTLGASSLQEAIQAGVVTYVLYGGRFFLALCLLHFMWTFMTSRSGGKPSPSQYLLLFFVLAIGLEGAALLLTRAWVSTAPLGAFHFLFVAAFLFALRVWFQQRSDALMLFLLLAVSWCASISWGFKTPVLFSPPLLVGGIGFAQWFAGDQGVTFHHRRNLVQYLLGGALFLALLNSLQPYRDLDGRINHMCELGMVENKLSLIVSGPNTCSKLAEFKKLAGALNGRIIVLPAFPLANFFLGQTSPMPLDWPMSIEMGRAYSKASKSFDENVAYVLLEKAAVDGFNFTKMHIPFIERVKAGWKQTAEGRWYAVYQNPAKAPSARNSPFVY